MIKFKNQDKYAFIPVLFQGLREGKPGRGFSHLPMKQTGMELPYLTKTAPENWMASFVITGHLIAALRVQEEFQMADHSGSLQEGRSEVQKMSILRT